MKFPILKLLIVGIGHITFGYVLFRCRTLYKDVAIFHSDFFVIALPAVAALTLYILVLRGVVRDWLPNASPNAASFALGFILTLVSEAILLYAAFNRFGT